MPTHVTRTDDVKELPENYRDISLRHVPSSEAHSTRYVIEQLEEVIAILREYQSFSDKEIPAYATQPIKRAHDILKERVHDELPYVQAWCVVRTSLSFGRIDRSVWPFMAFTQKRAAEAWLDFLSDFYSNYEAWDVEWCFVNPAYVNERLPSPLGHNGYHKSDRNSARQSQMKRYRQDWSNGWVKLTKAERAKVARGEALSD